MKDLKQLNPYLKELDVDYFLHLGLNSGMDLKATFGDVKFVIMSGTEGRATAFATKLKAELNDDAELKPMALTERYFIYKIKHVMVLSHGIGGPSLAVLLHELTKVFYYAGATDVKYIRTGTCGGVGVPIGTLVFTKRALNGELKPTLEVVACGKRTQRPTVFDDALTQQLFDIAKEKGLPCALGDTMVCDDYYESQARVDGVLCEYTKEERDAFLKKCFDSGVRNMEMEGLALGAFCGSVGIPCAMLAVAFIDRLEGDQVRGKLTQAQVDEYGQRPYEVVVEFVKRHS